MNILARCDQLNELEDLQHSLQSLFHRSSDHWSKGHQRLAEWIPLVDVSEDACGYVLKVELPQVRKDDVKIAIEDGMLTITGDRKFDQNRKRENRVERTYGRFAHSFLLPKDARPARVTAVFKDRVLTVRLNRNDTGRRRQAEGRGCFARRSAGRERPGSSCPQGPKTRPYDSNAKPE